MGIFVLTTQLHNQTDLPIEFDVEKGFCPLRGLPPDKTRSVKLSQILRCCRERGSPDWPIRVLINDVPEISIYPRHLLFMTRIVFKFKPNSDGVNVLCAEGIKEKGADYVLRLKSVIGDIFGRNSRWDKRPVIEIAQAEPTRSRNLSYREFEASNLMVPSTGHGTSLPQRQAAPSAGGTRSAATSPPQQEAIRRRRNGVGGVAGGRTTSESVLNSGENSTTAAARDQKRSYRLIPLQKRDTYTHVLLFCFAFILVAFARFYF